MAGVAGAFGTIRVEASNTTIRPGLRRQFVGSSVIDLNLGATVREETDDATGISQRIVADWRAAPKGNELAPKIIIAGEDGEPAVSSTSS